LQEIIITTLAKRASLKEHFTSDLSSNIKTQSISKIDRKFVNKFTSVVESSFGNDEFNVEEICKVIVISRIQLYRKVKALMM
jgi:hypothetical protein